MYYVFGILESSFLWTIEVYNYITNLPTISCLRKGQASLSLLVQPAFLRFDGRWKIILDWKQHIAFIASTMLARILASQVDETDAMQHFQQTDAPEPESIFFFLQSKHQISNQV